MKNKIEIDGSVQDVIESLHNNKDSFLSKNNSCTYFKVPNDSLY